MLLVHFTTFTQRMLPEDTISALFSGYTPRMILNNIYRVSEEQAWFQSNKEIATHRETVVLWILQQIRQGKVDADKVRFINWHYDEEDLGWTQPLKQEIRASQDGELMMHVKGGLWTQRVDLLFDGENPLNFDEPEPEISEEDFLIDLLQRVMSETRPYCRPAAVKYDKFPHFKEAVELPQGQRCLISFLPE